VHGLSPWAGGVGPAVFWNRIARALKARCPGAVGLSARRATKSR
jgi:hypothetical protein